MRLTFSVKTLIKTLVPFAALAMIGMATPAMAQPVANPVASFAGLDKITGRITRFDVYIDESVLFGALEITPRACYTRPATESQGVSAFLEVDQRSLTGVSKRIFSGWMFADSPALNAVDHAIYDVWLVECKISTDVPAPDQR